MPEPSIHKLYEKVGILGEKVEALYNRHHLGLAYHPDGKPVAVEKTCSWCDKGEDGLSECAREYYGKAMYGCSKWKGKR